MGALVSTPGTAPVSGRPVVRRLLPAWPFYLLFAGFGAFWFLGLAAFAVFLCSVPMAVLMVLRGGIRMPRAFGLWLGFLVCAFASVVVVEGFGRSVGYGTRMANYVGATIVFLYVYNSPRDRLTDRRLLIAMAGFLATVVAGGWLGVLVPDGQLSTLAARVLPRTIVDNEFVQALVLPRFAEVQQPYGSPIVFNRPSAPFPYTNAWGTNFTLLVFFGFAMIVAFRSTLAKVAAAGLLVVAAYPALETGNRGMLLGIGIFLLYGIARLTMRGRTGPLLTLAAVGLVAVAAGLPGFVADSIAARQAYSSSNDTRSSVYAEAFQGALDSPVLGQGTPKASANLEVAVGTQGHVWNVMFSYGFIALALFLGWFLFAAWGSRHATGSARLWLHVAACVPLLTLFYYGYDGPQLAVAMVACAAALRAPAPDTPAPRVTGRPRRELLPH